LFQTCRNTGQAHFPTCKVEDAEILKYIWHFNNYRNLLLCNAEHSVVHDRNGGPGSRTLEVATFRLRPADTTITAFNQFIALFPACSLGEIRS
jgi:hypothetical protein